MNGLRVQGLPIKEPPQSDVEVGIDRVFAAQNRDEILVFSDLRGYLDEKLSYSRELDERGEPTEKIDAKETFHFMDAERYIIGYLKSPRTPPRIPKVFAVMPEERGLRWSHAWALRRYT